MKLTPLATFEPPASTRGWQSVPHPTLPLLCMCPAERTARIYSLRSFKLHSTVSGGHKRSIRSAAWQPGVKGAAVLATGSFDSSVGIWRKYNDAGDDEEGLGVVPRKRNDEDDDIDADEDSDEGWNFSIILDGHDSEVKSVAFNAGGQFIATCSRDKSVWIWEELEEDNWETVAVLTDHDGDVKCVAWHPSENLLASGSYDDTVRLFKEDSDDWVNCAVLSGHTATVWCVAFEPLQSQAWRPTGVEMSEQDNALLKERKKSGPRLTSCSDDMTVRIWKRINKGTTTMRSSMPSIINTGTYEEDWEEECTLPTAHVRPILSVAWSPTSGRVASVGGDGKIVVYDEQFGSSNDQMEVDTGDKPQRKTKWVVVAEIGNAHGVYEINHVCWSKRWDKDKRSENDEMIITTGDDGEVKAWILDASA